MDAARSKTVSNIIELLGSPQFEFFSQCGIQVDNEEKLRELRLQKTGSH
jgi:hypothetical protein